MIHTDRVQHTLMTFSWTSQGLQKLSDEIEWRFRLTWLSAICLVNRLCDILVQMPGREYAVRGGTGRRLQSACRRMTKKGHTRARRQLIHLVQLDNAHRVRFLRAEYDDNDERTRSHAIWGFRWLRSQLRAPRSCSLILSEHAADSVLLAENWTLSRIDRISMST